MCVCPKQVICFIPTFDDRRPAKQTLSNPCIVVCMHMHHIVAVACKLEKILESAAAQTI